jgi:hypothetical protein
MALGGHVCVRLRVQVCLGTLQIAASRCNVQYSTCRQFPLLALYATTFESACGGSTPPGATRKEAANAVFLLPVICRRIHNRRHRLPLRGRAAWSVIGRDRAMPNGIRKPYPRRRYGPAHRAVRQRLAPVAESGQTTCCECGREITPGLGVASRSPVMTVRVGSERRMRAATLAPVGRRPRAANFHEGLTGGLEGGSTIRRSGRGCHSAAGWSRCISATGSGRRRRRATASSVSRSASPEATSSIISTTPSTAFPCPRLNATSSRTFCMTAPRSGVRQP